MRLPRKGLDTQQDATQRFYDVVWPHLPAVLRVARILTGNEAEADDLAQDTMLKAFRGIDGLKEGTDAKAWLLTILRHARIDRVRSNRSSAGQVSLSDLAGDPPAEAAPDDAAWERPEEILQAFGDQEIIDALQHLPEDIRWTLLLVDVEGVDQREAAELLGVPVGTIKSRGHRGRAMLRSILLPLAKERRLVGN